MLYDYKWVPEQSDSVTYCKSKECTKAHYRDGKRRFPMGQLRCTPERPYYVNVILLCNECKRLKLLW